MEIENLQQGLEKIKESESKRGATTIVGWLNRRYGNTTETRRTIQGVASKKKHEGGSSKEKKENVK